MHLRSSSLAMVSPPRVARAQISAAIATQASTPHRSTDTAHGRVEGSANHVVLHRVTDVQLQPPTPLRTAQRRTPHPICSCVLLLRTMCSTRLLHAQHWAEASCS